MFDLNPFRGQLCNHRDPNQPDGPENLSSDRPGSIHDHRVTPAESCLVYWHKLHVYWMRKPNKIELNKIKRLNFDASTGFGCVFYF